MNTEGTIYCGNALGIKKFGRRKRLIAHMACIQIIQLLTKVAVSHLLRSLPAVRATSDQAFWHHLVGFHIFTSISKALLYTTC